MKLVYPELEEAYKDLVGRRNREAAEIAYALGTLCKRSGNIDGMRMYREESTRLFKELKVETLESAIPLYESINDVLMPDLIHEGVVARDLSDAAASH